jgi:hypothetical protein
VAVLSVVGKHKCVPSKNNIPVQANKILSTFSRLYEVNTSISRRCVGDILSERNKWEKETFESLKWLTCAERTDAEGAFVIWIGQVRTKNETAIDEVIKEQVTVLGYHKSVTSFVHKDLYVFCFKNEIIEKTNRPTV